MRYELTLGHLYPAHLNMYGDRGNVLALSFRALARGIALTVIELHPGDHLLADSVDLLFMGGGQDTQQWKIATDLMTLKADPIREAVKQGVVILTICGGYQLLGQYYQPHEGDKIPGLGILDAYTVAGPTRFIGNVVVERPDGSTLVGFENHSGLTFLGDGLQPLGRVRVGAGNNGQDGMEGAVQGAIYGTYLHGSLLPKNPALTDELLLKALQRRYGADVTLPELESSVEMKAHQVALHLGR